MYIYIFCSLASLIFSIFRGEIGSWIAFVAVILRLFFPKRFPEWAELPAALILLMIVAPSLIATTVRDDWIGVAICLVIAAYLLQEHIRASGGFRNAFTQPHGIICLFIYPVWALVLDIL
ncbi:cold-regulated 413 plasma membrane protein 1-like [Rosa rugosa]|uniref:cold-regulated 413 plasma membrane protein 1-like n=1 Tax=Rosa rugosa TaxID=74645 RepID=UPI002B40F5D8|nr:cold-regulated 413 plasma membrane protein 1-like [Rosa rugosa]